jgi:hypothetical protein
MKKIFIFGASSGALIYLRHIEKESNYELLGFIDNDKQKHHTKLNEKTIYPPDILHSVAFDEVHIASMWEKPIKKQLIEEFSIPEKKIMLQPKWILKGSPGPFSSDEGQLLAKHFITETCSFFNSINIPIYLSSGSLLGICRDKEFIRWDDDLDLFIIEKHSSKVLSELHNLFNLPSISTYFNFELQHNTHSILIVLTPKEHLKNVHPIPIEIEFAYEKNGELIMYDLFHMPMHFLSPITWIDLHPGKASTFSKPHEYLTHLYGDWKNVVQDWKYSDYNNLITKS